MTDSGKIVDKLRPIDDIFFQKLIENNSFCEELLQTILQDSKLQIIECEPQKNLRNIIGRSVILDALCKTYDEKYINVELQKDDNDNHQKRVRYNGSNIDTYITEKNTKFDELPDVYVVYISAFDVFNASKTIYHIDRVVRETTQVVDNGFHEIYVNTKIDDGSIIAGLMQLFNKNSIPDDKRYPHTCNAIRNLKEGKERETMCEEVEKYAQEMVEKNAKQLAEEYIKQMTEENAKQLAEEYVKQIAEENAKETAKKMFQDGFGIEQVRKYVSDISTETLEQLYKAINL